MSEPIEFNTRFLNLTEQQQVLLQGWRASVNDGAPGPKSLWVYGERGTGSSYIATCALHRMVLDHRDWDYEYYRAQKMINAMHNRWNIERQLPTPDEELFREYLEIEEDFRYLWEKAQIVFVDNLYHTMDLGFWRRHLHQNLEERVKMGKPTILATSAAPNVPAFADITRVIENHFVVVHATR